MSYIQITDSLNELHMRLHGLGLLIPALIDTIDPVNDPKKRQQIDALSFLVSESIETACRDIEKVEAAVTQP